MSKNKLVILVKQPHMTSAAESIDSLDLIEWQVETLAGSVVSEVR